MAVLARGNELAQQRLDLTTILAIESFTAFDFRSLMTFFVGSSASYILRGFHVTGKSGLTVSINQADAVVANPQDANGSFYRGLPSDPDAILTLPANQTNIFVEFTFKNVTQAPVTAAFWNPLALTGSDVAGDEFSASTDSQVVLQLVITANTTGFTPGSTPLYKVTTDSSSVTSIEDARNLMFRLGTGGVTPNPAYRFPWSVNRHDSVLAGPGVDNDSNSSFLRQDGTGVLNDKGIYDLKSWMNAVMTRFIELSGSSLWFSSGSANVPVTGLSLASAFFDSDNGSYINPSSTNALIWSKDTGTGVLTLQSNGTAISSGRGTVEWQYNYGSIKWELGGTFVNNAPGGTRTYQVPTFTSPAPANGGNVYLFLEREVPKGSGNPVQWASVAADTIHLTNPSQDVSGQAGDFVGIAIGDYIRKISEGYSRYSQVTKMVDGLGSVYTTAGYVADSTISGLELADAIISGPSSEPLIYFRSRYSNADLYADQVAGQYNFRDIDYTWIGRRIGQNFILKNHGTIQPGEKFKIEDSSSINGISVGDSGHGLMLYHAKQASFTTVGGYVLLTGSGNLLTIRRRKRDNTVPSPGPLNTANSDSYLTYTLPAPVATMAVGDAIWVKLNDTASGALTAGNVTDPTDAAQDTNIVTNVYQILPAGSSPLRTYNNRDVYLLARCVGTDKLQFSDDTILCDYGALIPLNERVDGNLQVTGTLSLSGYTPNGILFIDSANNIAEDVTNLAYDKTNAKVTMFNYLFGVNTLEQLTPADMTWFSTIGAHTLNVMSPGSTFHIKGALIVDQGISSTTTTTLVVDNKTLTLGVGNPNNGGAGDGINIADNTLFATSYATTSGTAYVSATYSAAHGYVLGDQIGVETSDPVGGITAGQINRTYTVVAGTPTLGQASITDATHMRFATGGTATSTASVTTSPTVLFRTYLTPSSIYLTAADGSATAITSWAFTVKGKNPVTVTPVTGYTVVPTLNASEATAGRIMFSGVDASGPTGITTTIDEDAGLFWDNTNKRLGVGTSSPQWSQDVRGIAAFGDGTGTEIFLRSANGFNNLGAWHLSVRNDVGAAGDDLKFFRFISNSPADIPLQISNSTGRVWIAATGSYSTTPTFTSNLNIGTNSNVSAVGGITFGTDTTLYRGASGRLNTDGIFQVGNALNLKDSTTNTVSLKAATTTTSYQMLLPAVQGPAYGSMVNDGTGALSWYTGVNAFTGSSVSLSNGARNDQTALNQGSALRVAGQFTIGASTPLVSLAFQVKGPGGAIPATLLQAYVFADASGAPGTLLATSTNSIDPNTISSASFSTQTFTFTGFTGTTGVPYWYAIGITTYVGVSSITIGLTDESANGSIYFAPSGPWNPYAVFRPTTTIVYAGAAGNYWLRPNAAGYLDNTFLNYPIQFPQVGIGAAPGTALLQIGTNTTAAAGGIQFGTDTPLYRTAVGVLQTTGIQANQAAFGTTISGTQVLGIGTNTTTAAGGVLFGTDTTLYRSAANTLKTNGSFVVGGSLQLAGSTSGILTLSAAPVTASYPLVMPAGQGAISTTLVNDGAGNLSWSTATAAGFNVNYGSTKTANYNMTTTDTVVPVDTTAGSFNVVLPASVAGNKGQIVIIKDVGNFIATNAYTLVPNGLDTIDGTNASIVVNFANGTALQLIANGSGGWILT